MPEGLDDKNKIEKKEGSETVERPQVDSTEKPTEITPEQRTTQVAEVDKKIDTEQQNLNEVRARLGLPPSDESAALNDLRGQRDRLTEGFARAPSPEQAAEGAVRKMVSDVGDNIGRLANIFRRRDSENLYPLLERQDVSHIGLAAQSLNARSLSTPKDREDVVQALETMRRGFENFGSYRATTTRENPDSLRAIATFAQESMTHLRTLQRAVASGDTEEVARAAGQLANKLEEVRTNTVARRGRVDQYLRR